MSKKQPKEPKDPKEPKEPKSPKPRAERLSFFEMMRGSQKLIIWLMIATFLLSVIVSTLGR